LIIGDETPRERGQQWRAHWSVARQSLIDDHGWTITDAGLGPCVSVSPDPVQLDATTVGDSSEITITVTNSGGSDLVLPANALTLSGDAAFALAANACSGKTLSAGGDCTVDVRFSPASAGDKAAGLQVISNAVSSPDVVSLKGTGIVPGFNATPDPVAFPAQTVGTAADPQTVTVTNGGPGKLTVGAVGLTGDAAFTVASDTCSGTSLTASKSCTVTVGFAPTAVGSVSGQLTFTTNDAGSPHVVSVTGTGKVAKLKKQALRPKLPKRVKLNGLTVITPANARTNAGQRVRTIIKGGPAKASAAGEVRYFTVVRGPKGKTSIRTYGHRDLKLKVSQKAPAVTGYTAFARSASYIRGRR